MHPKAKTRGANKSFFCTNIIALLPERGWKRHIASHRIDTFITLVLINLYNYLANSESITGQVRSCIEFIFYSLGMFSMVHQ